MTPVESVHVRPHREGEGGPGPRTMASQAQHEKFAKSLTPDERMLVTLRDDLYNGSWEQMVGDLKDRLKGKPYIFKLVNRIQDDIQRIEKLHGYEKKHKVDLTDFIDRKKEEQ